MGQISARLSDAEAQVARIKNRDNFVLWNIVSNTLEERGSEHSLLLAHYMKSRSTLGTRRPPFKTVLSRYQAETPLSEKRFSRYCVSLNEKEHAPLFD